ncbi:HAD family hydrolase [Ferrimonas balearica]|uniref:HAD family hydrolase n=1 Tax=Ferrimonas balearica TaxID=44012 RepID=UPI001C9A14D4|nr:HAD-IA family hydrolase [Ferrimonas balearica]MBY5920360.1 HAD-IA family hydrolase [Ferrimonas balearica]MBY5996955.1 HAD-IA family hydrolase [Ferrimonas balearica]
MSIQGVLFDLDGTLLDTALDLGAAANRALARYGYPPLSDEHAYQYSSHGSRGLLQAALGPLFERTDYHPLKDALLDAYLASLCVHTRPYDGIHELLTRLDAQAVPWGIVTNKPGWLTDPLLAQLPLFASSRINVSGDTFDVSKPHPKPLLAAAESLQVDPGGILYVGDAERDMQAAQSAGMRGCVALWGYLRPEDSPLEWPAEWFCDSPYSLVNKLGFNE